MGQHSVWQYSSFYLRENIVSLWLFCSCFFSFSWIKIHYAGLKCSTQVDLQTKVARLCTKQSFIATDFITKSVTKFITKSDWLHHKKYYKIHYKRLQTLSQKEKVTNLLQKVTDFIPKKHYEIHLKKVTDFITKKNYKIHYTKFDFITKKCYKIHSKKLLTSPQKSVTKFITTSYWLHHKKMLQNSLQKVTDFITKKCYKNYYKRLLTLLGFVKTHSKNGNILPWWKLWINQWINEKSDYFMEW